MYLFADVRILFDLFSLIGKCPKCNSAIDCEIDFPNKRGLAQKVVLTCDGTNDKDCDWHHATYLSDTVRWVIINGMM